MPILLLKNNTDITIIGYMITSHKYYSIRDSKSQQKKRKKQEISQLALDSFNAFKPFINVFDCGLSYDGSPYHLITKEDWRLFARYKAGEKGLTYPDGRKFNPYLDVVGNIFVPKHVHNHIHCRETSYYTSGQNGLGLLYLDIDAHEPWQKDEYKAKAVLERIFPFGYFRASGRGQNGYVKVSYVDAQEFNRVAGFLQGVLKRLFLHLGILCDVEVKGTISHGGKSGSSGKTTVHDQISMLHAGRDGQLELPPTGEVQGVPDSQCPAHRVPCPAIGWPD